MLLYKLTFASGKSYIGQTLRTLETRIAQHKQAANADSLLAVHCAWRLYGAPAVEVLGRYKSASELHKAEIEAIVSHATMSPAGYNVGFGGETAPSKNPDVAAKIAAKATGRLHHTDTKAAIGEASSANWQSEAYREKVSAALKASWTKEMRDAAGARSTERWDRRRAEGWTLSDTARAKISAANSNPSADTRAKMSASAKARGAPKKTPEICAKLAVSVAASWQDPDIRARRSAAIREGHRRAKEARLAAAQAATAI